MTIRGYDMNRHREACKHIWQEVGWLPDFPGGIAATEQYFAQNPCLVAETESGAEALAVAVPGELRHLECTLPFWAVTSVTVGRAGRKKGLGASVTAEITALGADSGCAVAGLGIFEQGYYNRLGYGNGPYNRIVTFRPSDLPGTLPFPERPCGIGPKNLDEVYESIRNRMACHGQATLSRNFYKAELQWDSKAFGLGCRGSDGRLSHHLWFCGVSGEHGPYRVGWLCYQSPSELLELLGMIRSLGDQVDLVTMEEPPHLQFQDLMETPIRNMRMLGGDKHRVGTRAISYTQARILRMDRTMLSTVISWGEVAFNLTLSDPVARFLPDNAPWKGCAGEYTVVLGPESSAEPRHTRGLPEMRAGVGGFTRMWLGVRQPSVLALTDEIEAPGSLLRDLDRLLALPEPRFNCDF